MQALTTATDGEYVRGSGGGGLRKASTDSCQRREKCGIKVERMIKVCNACATRLGDKLRQAKQSYQLNQANRTGKGSGKWRGRDDENGEVMAKEEGNSIGL